jgi:hypothetical protein
VSRRAASNHRSGRESLLFRGSLLQGLNGSSLDSRLEEDGSFCDIDFMLAAAQQVMRWVGASKGCIECRGSLQRAYSTSAAG